MRNVEDMVREEIGCCVTDMVEFILAFGEWHKTSVEPPFTIDDIENTWYQDEDGYEEYRDPYEWWIVSDWLARRLAKHDEVLIREGNRCIWGRCTTGQAIKLDWVINQIWKEFKEEVGA